MGSTVARNSVVGGQAAVKGVHGRGPPARPWAQRLLQVAEQEGVVPDHHPARPQVAAGPVQVLVVALLVGVDEAEVEGPLAAQRRQHLQGRPAQQPHAIGDARPPKGLGRDLGVARVGLDGVQHAPRAAARARSTAPSIRPGCRSPPPAARPSGAPAPPGGGHPAPPPGSPGRPAAAARSRISRSDLVLGLIDLSRRIARDRGRRYRRTCSSGPTANALTNFTSNTLGHSLPVIKKVPRSGM